jgi:UDP-N-acetylmuramoyl-L-alanyl-D-glutamate--2,6-diaminopimelate ligase
VLEATSHGLDLHRLDETRFVIGAVTNVTHEHLEHHGTVQAYRRAKGILFERVAEAGGTAVVNADDPGAMEMIPFAASARVLRYSAAARPAEIAAERIELRSDGSSFDLTDGTTRRSVNVPLVGGFNVENSLCAAAVAVSVGLSWDAVVEGLENVEPVPGRLVRLDAGQAFSVIVDYAHTPESLAKVLRLLNGLHPSGRLIVVSGSAGERDVQKRPLQGAVCARLADFSVFTSEDPRFEDPDLIIRQIAEGAVEVGGIPGETFTTITDRREAIRHAISLAGPGDCVLLAGKGHEGSMIWGREKRPWSEADVANEILKERAAR